MSMHPALVLVAVSLGVPSALLGVAALVIVFRARKEDLPAVARALGSWWRRRR